MYLAEFLAPLSPDHFFDAYFDQRPLHLTGNTERFGKLLSMKKIDDALAMTQIWSDVDLQLLMSGKRIPSEQYCHPLRKRNGEFILRPDADRIRYWVSRGASVVLNGVDTYTDGLREIRTMFKDAGFSEVWANIYVSQKDSMALDVHHDTHDVWVLQASGLKTWNIWEEREEWPIDHHPKSGRSRHSPSVAAPKEKDSRHGKLLSRVTMRQGDVLYLPHGWYHSALAEIQASVHVTFGVRHSSGLDLLQVLFERAIDDKAFRRPIFQRPGIENGHFELQERIAELGRRLAGLCKEPGVVDDVARFIKYSSHYTSKHPLPTVSDLAAISE